ncbi:MAG: GAF domain-containing protein [Candidatus Methanoperedens sp.]|nr:GAF domain-containing protein [Candidatus Methanoperedens sp.]MCE8428614.1 GAF domain-containing protein [Candidatus Methanoperedens sp.]
MKSLNISQKLIISSILISVLPYAIISYINYSAEEKAFEQKIFDDLAALAEAKNTHITTVVNFRIEQVNEVATSNFLQEINSKNIENLDFNLHRVKNGIPEFFEISALDMNGTVIASTEKILINKSLADEEFFKKGKEGLFLDMIKNYNNTTAYLISHPLTNRISGKFMGVIAVRVQPRFIYDVTHDYTGLGETGETLLVQKRDNEIVFLNPLRHDPDAALNLRYPLNSSLAIPAIHAVSGEKGTIRGFDYRGKDVFAAFSYIPAGNWGIVVKMDSQEALIPVTLSKWRSFALGLIYLFIVVSLAYLIGKKYTGPLIRLSIASKKVAKGYLTVHIEPESSDEIGELAQSFNIMVQKLKELYEGLDLKVKERTKDLNKKNLELEGLIKTNQSISSGLDLSKVLDIAVREAVRIVNVSYCSIVLIEENKDYGTVVSEYCPQCHFMPTTGEVVNLKDCRNLNAAYMEKRYVLVQDTSRAELSTHELEMVNRLNMKSILFVPLVLGEKSLGAMHLSNFESIKIFTEDEINICQTIANQVAIAIENAHLYQELKQHDETLETLFEIDRVVSQSLDLDELLREAVIKTIQVTSSDAGWIYLLKEDGETLNLKTYTGISISLAEAASELKKGQGISGMAIMSGKPITMDIENYPNKELLPLMEKDNIASLAGVPLMAKGKTVGAMILSNRQHRVFLKEDLDLLSSIGGQIGVAVENARLFSELKYHDQRLETLFKIDRVVSQSLDLDEIFREALAKTIQVTSSDAGAIYLLDNDQNILKLKTSSGISLDFAEAVSNIKIGEGISGIAVKMKKPYIIDIDQYPSRYLLPSLEKEGFITLASTPLLAKGKVIGAMNLASRKRRIFSKDDIDVLASIGGQIGVAFENARLYQESKISLRKLQKAYHELESLNRMKSEFLSNVSHELKTPLVSIRGYSELIYDEKIGTLTPIQKKSLEAIIRNTDRLTRLIDSLLFLSIQQMGKTEVKAMPKPVSIDEIISSSMADMKVQAARKNITLAKDFKDDIRILGDRDRLTEVFINLLDNAIKFTDSGGKINVNAIDEDGNLHITITDTGVGIAEDLIPNLFQRFYQADASATRKYGGTGLGLYICKNIIDAHNGKIWAESKIGIGTTMHILLPKK